MKKVKMSALVFVLLTILICSCYKCEVLLKQKCFTSLSDGTNCGVTPNINFPLLLPDKYFGTICCYEDGLECFSNKQGTPFECFALLPDCMSQIRPQFYLYTPETGDDVQEFEYSNFEESIQKLTIAPDRETFILIHGFGDEWPKPWIFEMKNALIDLGHNVLVLRWTGGSQNYTSIFNYFKAAANARTVGAAVAKVMENMVRYKKLDLDATTIVGYSLGAHLAGYVGSYLSGIKRIIGLDPAGPLFTCQNLLVRLNPTNAKIVQVIHTNGDSFFYSGVGTMQAMGHIDYFANGGRLQPNCNRGPYLTLQQRLQGHLSDSHEDFWCSHTRAAEIFIEMSRNAQLPYSTCSFTSFPCQNHQSWKTGDCFDCPSNGCPVAGYETDISTPNRGKYFFNTKSRNTTAEEHCGSQLLISLKSDKDVEGKIVLRLALKNRFNQIEFQNSHEKLLSGKRKNRVVVINWLIQRFTEFTITYFTNLKDHKSDWNLTECSITDSRGKSFRSVTTYVIRTGVTTKINLF